MGHLRYVIKLLSSLQLLTEAPALINVKWLSAYKNRPLNFDQIFDSLQTFYARQG